MTDKQYFNKLWDESPMGRSGCCSPVIAVVLCVILLLCSCATRKSIEYVDKEVVKYQKEVVHDTIIQNAHDSVYHTIFQKGDTIYETKYVEKTKCRDRVVVRVDTCYHDSIQTEIKKTTVEKHVVPKWCYACLVVCALFLVLTFIKLVRWIQIH